MYIGALLLESLAFGALFSIIVLFLQALAFGTLSSIVAKDKNRNAGGWFMIGFIFGLFGFIASLVVGTVEHDTSRQMSNSQGFDPGQHDKKCPDCAEYIKIQARICRFCGREFSDREVRRRVGSVRESTKEHASPEVKERPNPLELYALPVGVIAVALVIGIAFFVLFSIIS